MLWKNADVILLQKEGRSGKYPQIYRTISVRSGLLEVVERVILNRLKVEVKEHHVIQDHHFGFRRKHGTELQVCRGILQDLLRKKTKIVVLLVVKKAFDRVSRAELIKKVVDFRILRGLVRVP